MSSADPNTHAHKDTRRHAHTHWSTLKDPWHQHLALMVTDHSMQVALQLSVFRDRHKEHDQECYNRYNQEHQTEKYPFWPLGWVVLGSFSADLNAYLYFSPN